jgi:hypothetical protein
MNNVGKGFALLLSGMIATLLFIQTATAQTSTPTHACYTIKDSIVLADHLVTKQWVGYHDLFAVMEREGKCRHVFMSLPAPPNQLYIAQGDGYLITVHPIIGESGLVFGLLFRGSHPVVNSL